MSAPHLQFLMLTFAGWLNRSQQDVIEYVQAEIRALRDHISGNRLSLPNDQRRRLANKATVTGRERRCAIGAIVTPDTLLRWYPLLIVKKFNHSVAPNGGRPKPPVGIEQLILKMAVDNSGWRYTRICGALYDLGQEFGNNTAERIPIEHGIDPAPLRMTGVSGKTVPRAQVGAIAATDFISAEVLNRTTLVRYFVLFIIDLQTCIVEVAGIAKQPDGQRIHRIARIVTDSESAFLNRARYFIRDRSPLATAQFMAVLDTVSVETVKLPARSPNANAYSEGFVRSIKSECLAQRISLGEPHLRTPVTENAEPFHTERDYRGFKNKLVVKPRDRTVTKGNMASRGNR